MNTIRTPRQGTNATSRRIAEAVDDEEWQKFRLSMKGKLTDEKLQMLEEYMQQTDHTHPLDSVTPYDLVHCDVCIRVDNYIKALCRGGQLYPGETLARVLHAEWDIPIKKD